LTSVYYLKYRPQKIDQLDLKSVREQLGQMLASKNMPQALLFAGPKGLGKTSAARIVAKAINCQTRKTRKNIEPCNKCSLCQSITQGTALDLIEIDAASNRGIDDIRELREKIKLTPSLAQKKVYVIDEVHMLTTEAFNALLKTLEEPPEHAFFVLCTTEIHKLPETITSRCLIINFTLASRAEIGRSLKRIVKGEKLKISDKALDLISQKAGSSFRDAAKILQQLSFGGKNISWEKTTELLEQSGQLDKNILSALSRGETKKALKELDKAVQKGADLKDLTINILQKLRQLLLNYYQVAEVKMGNYNLTLEQIKELIGLFDQASRQLKGAVVAQLPLEMAIVNFRCKAQSAKRKIVLAEKSSMLGKAGKIKNSKLKTEKQVPVTNNQDDLDKWRQVLALVKKDNPTIEGLLKATEFKSMTDDNLVVEVFYQFHQNKLTSDEYLPVVEKRAQEVFGDRLKLEYRLKSQ
jgi:DNA polymerase-3 subunit gamma/tau